MYVENFSLPIHLTKNLLRVSTRYILLPFSSLRPLFVAREKKIPIVLCHVYSLLLEQVQKFNEGKILTRFKQLGRTALNFVPKTVVKYFNYDSISILSQKFSKFQWKRIIFKICFSNLNSLKIIYFPIFQNLPQFFSSFKTLNYHYYYF